jgi:acyl-coenzyme A synthetase/AMP-(fatty) acid ligase
MSEYPQTPKESRSLRSLWIRNVEEGGGRIALYFDSQTYTHRELQRLVNACGNVLRGIGIGKGDQCSR